MSNGFMIKSSICIGLLLLAISAGCILSTSPDGSRSSSQQSPDTAIVSWIDAVNHKDLERLYLLAPDEIRNQISYEQFEMVNKNNKLLTDPNLTVTSYTVINETANLSDAEAMTVLIMQRPVSENSTNMESIPVFYTFVMKYENSQWKVWT